MYAGLCGSGTMRHTSIMTGPLGSHALIAVAHALSVGPSYNSGTLRVAKGNTRSAGNGSVNLAHMKGKSRLGGARDNNDCNAPVRLCLLGRREVSHNGVQDRVRKGQPMAQNPPYHRRPRSCRDREWFGAQRVTHTKGAQRSSKPVELPRHHCFTQLLDGLPARRHRRCDREIHSGCTSVSHTRTKSGR